MKKRKKQTKPKSSDKKRRGWRRVLFSGTRFKLFRKMPKPCANAKIKVISFDLDNTIWDNDPVIKKAVDQESTHIKTNFPKVFDFLGKNPSTMASLRGKVTWKNPDKAHDLNFIRKESLRLLATTLKLHPDDSEEFIESTFRAFDDARQQVHPHLYPGVLEMLQLLKKRGFILVANTNGTAYPARIPALLDVFDHHINAFTAGALKPSREPFEKILELTKVSREEVLHVGDNIIDDVKGSVDSGMMVVWINERHPSLEFCPTPHQVLGDSRHASKFLIATAPTITDVVEVLKHLGNDIVPSL